MIKVILVDAANTIIHKPSLWININKVLGSHGFNVSLVQQKEKHKLISELINFPDRTNEEFYRNFNSEFLLAIGIIPEENLLDELFKACTYLPWEAFNDVDALNSLTLKKAVLSNFNSGLKDVLDNTVSVKFDEIVVSEIEGVRKPQIQFYENAIKRLGVSPNEILYVGDSIKLDMIPAKKVGMNFCLIDRDNVFPGFKSRIDSFSELAAKVQELNIN